MLRKYLNRKNDHAISPVIGTILMIAATVIIAGAVYAAVNIYGGKNAKQTVDASWKAQALDTDGNGKEDTIKVTYVTGPTGVAASEVSVKVLDASGTTLTPGTSHGATASWSPGDYVTYTHTGTTFPQAAFVTVAQSGTNLLDQSLSLKE
jgi:flagellin-like protein